MVTVLLLLLLVLILLLLMLLMMIMAPNMHLMSNVALTCLSVHAGL